MPSLLIACSLLLLSTVSLAEAKRRPKPSATPVDVIIVANPAYAVGVAAVINASRFHSSAPVRVFVGYDGDPERFLDYLDCVRVDSRGVIVRRPLELIKQRDIPKAFIRGHDASRLSTPANYARFTIPRTFPEAGVAWYIDSDALPLGDLAGPEYARFVRSGAAVQAVGRIGTIQAEFDPAILPMYQARYHRPLTLTAPSWNAGVWLADFSQWPRLGVEADAVHWVKQSNDFNARNKKRLWKLNTQPLMYLIFHTSAKVRAQMLPDLWNCESYRHTCA